MRQLLTTGNKMKVNVGKLFGIFKLSSDNIINDTRNFNERMLLQK